MPKGVYTRQAHNIRRKFAVGAVCPECEKRPVVSKGLCTVCYKRKWNAENPEKYKAAKQRNHRRRAHVKRANDLQNKYGLTQEQYDALFAAQLGLCAICQSPPGRKALAVDHCHETGRVRGLLCSLCNQGIGCLKDSAELLIRAAQYLNK